MSDPTTRQAALMTAKIKDQQQQQWQLVGTLSSSGRHAKSNTCLGNACLASSFPLFPCTSLLSCPVTCLVLVVVPVHLIAGSRAHCTCLSYLPFSPSSQFLGRHDTTFCDHVLQSSLCYHLIMYKRGGG